MPQYGHAPKPPRGNEGGGGGGGGEGGRGGDSSGRAASAAGTRALALGPLWSWAVVSLPLVQVGRVVLNVHPILLVWMAAELIAGVLPGGMGLASAGAMVAAWMLVLMVREWCRVTWGRWVGSDAKVSTLWLLGGLEPVGRAWMPNPRLAEAGGLLFGMTAWPVLGAIVWLEGGWSAVVFDPLHPGSNELIVRTNLPTWAALAYWAHVFNVLTVCANLLVRAYPLDMARVLEARLTPWLGRAAVGRTVAVGVLTSGALFVLAGPLGLARLAVFAVVLLAWTAARWRAVQVFDAAARRAGGPDPADTDVSADTSARRTRRHGPGPSGVVADRTAAAATSDAAVGDAKPAALTVNDILSKISREGLASLTAAERETLERETRRMRGGPPATS